MTNADDYSEANKNPTFKMANRYANGTIPFKRPLGGKPKYGEDEKGLVVTANQELWLDPGESKSIHSGYELYIPNECMALTVRLPQPVPGLQIEPSWYLPRIRHIHVKLTNATDEELNVAKGEDLAMVYLVTQDNALNRYQEWVRDNISEEVAQLYDEGIMKRILIEEIEGAGGPARIRMKMTTTNPTSEGQDE